MLHVLKFEAAVGSSLRLSCLYHSWSAFVPRWLGCIRQTSLSLYLREQFEVPWLWEPPLPYSYKGFSSTV